MRSRDGIERMLAGGGMAVVMLLGLPCQALAADELSKARQLYAEAAYEETLDALSRLNGADAGPEAEEYRALCLLALNREDEAERAVERLNLQHPFPLEHLESRSPKFIDLYRGVRRRVLPSMIKASYAGGKASFDAKEYPAAAHQFAQALALIRTADDAAALGDLRLLATEFRTLAERLGASAAPATVLASAPLAAPATAAPVIAAPVVDAPAVAAPVKPAPVAAAASATPIVAPPVVPIVPIGAPVIAVPAGAPPVAAASPDLTAQPSASTPQSARSGISPPSYASRPFNPVPRVFSTDDRDVAPPVVIDQRLPAWQPPFAQFARRTFSGTLQVIVGEDGAVASAEILQPSFGPYDEQLLRSVKQWRYQPALKQDRPVQYRRIIQYVLKSSEQVAAGR